MPTLAALEVLLVDCQTTGATPGRAHLLEVAWCRSSAEASEPREIRAELVALPAGAEIPRRVRELTGLSRARLAGARPGQQVWQALAADARALGGDGAAPAVAHFSRFERGFLEELQRQAEDARPFPLELICTHEIAIRALPGLPRRGLRALAGYFGELPAEHRRAGDHVRATLAVWRGLCERLRTQEGVRSLDELQAWIARAAPSRRGGREFPLLRAERLALPEGPGVYRMLNRSGALLYLGKASSLRRRVNSYFRRRGPLPERSAELLSQVSAVEVRETASVLEAALLEVASIQRESPPYNLALRVREGELWFASPDLSALSPRPDPRHPLGPLPAREPVLALGELAAILEELRLHRGASEGGEQAQLGVALDPSRCRRALGIPAELGGTVDPGRFREGLGRFRAEHARELEAGSGSTPTRLLRLGVRLWTEARATPLAEPEEPALLDPPLAPGGRFDPERIATGLEAVVLRGAHLLRRGAWLCELSEAVLCWSPRGAAARVLMVSEGEPGSAEELRPGGPPRMPRWSRPRLERLAGFDRGKHDRLRVLSSELRRIAAEEGRRIELRLGERRLLDRPRLLARLSRV